MTQPTRYTQLAIGLAALALLAACGWGYAAETYRPQKTNPTDTGRVTYVAPTSTPAVVQRSPCEVNTFIVFRIDQTFRQTKELQCTDGKTLSLTRADITDEELRQAKLQNLPVGQWYLLVDPASTPPVDPKAISNDHLMGLSKVYQIKYYQHMNGANYIIYTFNDGQPSP